MVFRTKPGFLRGEHAGGREIVAADPARLTLGVKYRTARQRRAAVPARARVDDVVRPQHDELQPVSGVVLLAHLLLQALGDSVERPIRAPS